MYSLRRFSAPEIEAFLTNQAAMPFTYQAVGATRDGVPAPGFTVDHNRILLGHGGDLFERAVRALWSWRMFDLGWVSMHCASPPEQGACAAVLVKLPFLWALNSCRVVYSYQDLQGPDVRSTGFAYGTLPGHAECGEERFSIELRGDDGSVWYDIFAFSRVRDPCARCLYPVTRHLQRRFARDSMLAMTRAVGKGANGTGTD